LYFAEDPPRRLECRGDKLVLSGVAERLEGSAKLQPFRSKYRWIFDCSHLSSQYLIDFAASSDGKVLEDAARAAKGWLHLRAPSEWYSITEGLPCGRFASQQDEVACNKLWGWKASGAPPKAPGGIPSGRYFRGADNHFDTEQDSVEAFLLMYLRTEGSRAFLQAGQSWAQHYMDGQAWRTDGWRWKDGGVWWTSPLGNRAQRAADPVTGARAGIPKTKKLPGDAKASGRDLGSLRISRECYCHCYAAGTISWYLLTGDREGLEVSIDKLEQQYDTNKRARKRQPGTEAFFGRDATRSSVIAQAVRLALPTDPYVVEASEYFKDLYMKRSRPEVRGLVTPPGLSAKRARKGVWEMEKLVGAAGLKALKDSGGKFDTKTATMTDAQGRKWKSILGPCTWQVTYMAHAMDSYRRQTGDEDAADWLIAYGQALSKVVFQPKHYNLHKALLCDFPARGKCWDRASWELPPDSTTGEGVELSGYLAYFHVNIPAYAYELCGEPLLKQRARDYWYGTSHRGYKAKKMKKLGEVGQWANIRGEHNESVCYTGRAFWIWAHPRKDEKPPAAIADLSVSVSGERATVSFTAPADAGGGRVVRYQVKCSDKPIVDYDTFLKKFAAFEDGKCTNWWMAANLSGEPAPKAAGGRESFTVTGVPKGAKYFAVRAFDDSSNRGAMGNVAGK
jgi:hypothetical protein